MGGKAFIPCGLSNLGVPMNRKLDEFLEAVSPKTPVDTEDGGGRRKKKRLKSTSLESFLPEEHVNYFKRLRIGSKKIRNAKIEEL